MAADPQWRDLARYVLVTGVVMLVLFIIVGGSSIEDGTPFHAWAGLLQRILVVVWFAGLIVMARRALRVARRWPGGVDPSSHLTFAYVNLLNSTLVIAIVAGLPALAVTLAAQEVRPAAETKLVQLDGRAVRVQSYGLLSRRAGDPVVVFEAGATNALEAWGDIPGRVALEAPVIAYDRAGLGGSAWDSLVPSPRHVTDRLRRLLHLVGVEPPYVLVGYSWGGMLAHYYAGFYPADVSGLVLVDPGPVLTLSRAQHIAPFDSVGAGHAGYDAYWSGFRGFFVQAVPAVRAEFDVFRSLVDAELPQRDLRPLPAVPVAIIVAARYLDVPGLQLPYDPRKHFEVDLRQRMNELERWTLHSPKGTLVVSNHTTHAIPREDPGLIVWAVQRVLTAARSR